jgi:hypothetical protein
VPQAGRTFRIFVSSTFADLKAERNALQRYVFPRLRDLCLAHAARFQAIDLRWGISEEASLDQQTVPICLTEIERCQRTTPRPNFIILLGDRYGWRPPPATIAEDEFAEIGKRLTDAREERLLAEWYRRDDNAVPAVYELQPRENRFRVRSAWEPIERELWRVLLRATVDFPAERRRTYTASATELEILRGALSQDVADADEHVFAFLRTLKTERGAPLAEDLPADERVGNFVDLMPDQTINADAHGRLRELREHLRRRLGGNVHDFEATWREGGVSEGHIGTLPETLDECVALLDDPSAPGGLCPEVWRSLAGVILTEAGSEAGPVVTEGAAHEAFARERTAIFVGRDAILGDVGHYITGTRQELCAVIGAPGSGKSALVAKAAEQVRVPGAVVVARFIGASPGSSDIRSLLADLCRSISAEYADGTPVPVDYRELVSDFRRRLGLATPGKPLVIFLDALDQLSEAHDARSLAWLPTRLPKNTHIVVTTGPELLEPLVAELLKPHVLQLKGLSDDEGADLLGRWLDDAGRTLKPAQRSSVLAAFDRARGLPLYLKLAFEEARGWKSHAPSQELAGDVRGIVRANLFERLSRPEHHGALLVERSLGYLAASRHGLAEDELLDLLGRDADLYEHVRAKALHDLPAEDGERRIPVVLWSRLFYDLEPYLSERIADGTSLLTFYHRELRQAAEEAFLSHERRHDRHQALASYFRKKADPRSDGSWEGLDMRGVSELPFHLTEAAVWDELYETLTSFRFMERKAAKAGVVEQGGERVHAGVFQLQDDFELALRRMRRAD